MGLRWTGQGSIMPNEQLYRITEQPPISALLMEHRLRWLGHAARMADTAMVKQLLYGTAAGPTLDRGEREHVRSRSGPSWVKVAREDLQALGCALTWHVDCLNRNLGRGFVSSCSTVGNPTNAV